VFDLTFQTPRTGLTRILRLNSFLRLMKTWVLIFVLYSVMRRAVAPCLTLKGCNPGRFPFSFRFWTILELPSPLLAVAGNGI